MSGIRYSLSLLVGLFLMLCAAVRADLIQSDTFSTAENTDGWGLQIQIGSGSRGGGVYQGSMDGHSGALLFGLTTWGGGFADQDFIGETLGGGGESDDMVVALTNVAQQAVENGSVAFQFYANADNGGNGGGVVAPAGLYLYFTTSDGYMWYYDVYANNDQPVEAGWNFYVVDLTYDAGWDNDDGRVGSDFQYDMEQANGFGVWVVYQSWDNQVYALDDVEFYDVPASQVPEPMSGALLLLGAAVVARRLRRRTAGV
jgi:hypothetical protein